MLSYQHGFHAGNHADVLKHLTLLAILAKLQKKPKPYFYLDTHAGNGCYSLNKDTILHRDADMASQLSMSTAKTIDIVEQYKAIITPFTAKKMYPGSPLILDAVKRSMDNMHVSELHPQAFDELSTWTKQTGIQTHKRDGFELLNALIPPKPNRGMVLIDPPYEQPSEYQQVVDAISNALNKWPQGTFVVWYPLLSPTRLNRDTRQEEQNPKSGMSQDMLAALSKIVTKGLVTVSFAIQKPDVKVGMYGSGVAIINPPWQIDIECQEIVNILDSQIKIDDNNLSQVEWLVAAP